MKVINVTNIMSDGRFDVTNTSRYISLKEFNKSYRHFAIDPDDIVVASSGNTYGKVSRVKNTDLPLMMNTSVIRLHSRDIARLHDDYLYCYVRSQDFRNQVKKYVSGSAQPNFGPTHVRLMSLPLPPLETQRRIAAIIGAYDDLIDVNRRRVAVLEEMARGLFEEWFVRFRFPGHETVPILDTPDGPLPEGWRWGVFSELVAEVRQAVHPSEIDADTVYLGLEHLPRRSTTLADQGAAEDVTSLKLRFQRGDILFGKIRPYFHKVVWAPCEGVCSSDAIVWRPVDEHIAQALAVAASDPFVHFSVQTSNGTKMPRANTKVLANYACAMAPAALSRQFERASRPMIEAAAAYQAANQRLAASRDLLLPRLMSGQLSVAAAERELELA